MKKVLVVAAHPDDEILGVGGTIRRLADEGKMVRAVIIAEGLTSRNATRQETDKKELLELQEDTKRQQKKLDMKVLTSVVFLITDLIQKDYLILLNL